MKEEFDWIKDWLDRPDGEELAINNLMRKYQNQSAWERTKEQVDEEIEFWEDL